MENLEATGALRELRADARSAPTKPDCSAGDRSRQCYQPVGRRAPAGERQGATDDAAAARGSSREKRALVVPLARRARSPTSLAYVLVVVPAAASSRPAPPIAPRRPRRALQAAERGTGAARAALVAGKARADAGARAFYEKVLPADLSAARRLTYARAAGAGAARPTSRYETRRTEVEQPERTQRLGRLKIHMVLQGDYESIRQFIYALESAPEFVIIDDVTLAQARPDQAADAHARAVDLLPPGGQWQLNAAPAARCSASWSSSCAGRRLPRLAAHVRRRRRPASNRAGSGAAAAARRGARRRAARRAPRARSSDERPKPDGGRARTCSGSSRRRRRAAAGPRRPGRRAGRRRPRPPGRRRRCRRFRCKFIGIVEAAAATQQIAVLSDGRARRSTARKAISSRAVTGF